MWIALFIGRLLVAPGSFAIGVLAIFALQYGGSFRIPNLEPISNEEFASRISACDLGEPSGKFVGKRISINATVYHVSWRNDEHSEDFIFVHPLIPPGCTNSELFDPFIVTELDLQGYSCPNSNLKFGLGPFEREVDVHILGTVRKAEKSDSSVKYKIQPEKIEMISPWREFTPKGAA